MRIKGLVIPPAWRDVWIAPESDAHLQATGVDAAGRKQYLYHRKWREYADAAKFDRLADFPRRWRPCANAWRTTCGRVTVTCCAPP